MLLLNHTQSSKKNKRSYNVSYHCAWLYSLLSHHMTSMFHRLKNTINQRYQTIKTYYETFIVWSCSLPTSLRYWLGIALIIVGIIAIPHPLVAWRPLVTWWIAIITKKQRQDVSNNFHTLQKTIYDRMRTRWLRIVKKLPRTKTIKATLCVFKTRLANILF